MALRSFLREEQGPSGPYQNISYTSCTTELRPSVVWQLSYGQNPVGKEDSFPVPRLYQKHTVRAIGKECCFVHFSLFRRFVLHDVT